MSPVPLRIGIDTGGTFTDVAVLDRGTARLGPLVSLELPAIELELERDAPGQAIERLDRLIEVLPRPARYLFRRGEILRDAGCLNEARTSLRRALAVIAEVPEHRRRTRAWSELEASVRSADAALPEASSSSCPTGLSRR